MLRPTMTCASRLSLLVLTAVGALGCHAQSDQSKGPGGCCGGGAGSGGGRVGPGNSHDICIDDVTFLDCE
jgi:hypothetical protein